MSAPAHELVIRPIEPADDHAVASIIRTVMTELGACAPGFAIHDAEVDAMHAAYGGERAAYFVIEREGVVVGGGGVAPLAGGAHDVCELKKMYLLPEARGRGLGRRLLERALAAARERGFSRCYLETLDSMERARALYEANGFTARTGPLGATGHFGCNRWYERQLS
jgi:putative acetyltransferase